MSNLVAQVHRFGDKVAIYVGNGEMTYITAKQAQHLAKALRECAKSVVDVEFVDSNFSTVKIYAVSKEEADREAKKWPRNKGVLK